MRLGQTILSMRVSWTGAGRKQQPHERTTLPTGTETPLALQACTGPRAAAPRELHMPCASCGQILSLAAPSVQACGHAGRDASPGGTISITVRCSSCNAELLVRIKPYRPSPCKVPEPASAPSPSPQREAEPRPEPTPSESDERADAQSQRRRQFLDLERELSRIAAEEGDVSIPLYVPMLNSGGNCLSGGDGDRSSRRTRDGGNGHGARSGSVHQSNSHKAKVNRFLAFACVANHHEPSALAVAVTPRTVCTHRTVRPMQPIPTDLSDADGDVATRMEAGDGWRSVDWRPTNGEGQTYVRNAPSHQPLEIPEDNATDEGEGDPMVRMEAGDGWRRVE